MYASMSVNVLAEKKDRKLRSKQRVNAAPCCSESGENFFVSSSF